jgi:Predicted flavoprotein
MRVLTISGSLRPDSTTPCSSARRRSRHRSASSSCALPSWPPSRRSTASAPTPAKRPAAVRELSEQIEAADALLIATPEYNGSIPGVLKNALDWVSTPFPDNVLRGKPVAVIGASTGGYGGMWAQAELRKVLGLTGARW